jgi:hypothetical protein
MYDLHRLGVSSTSHEELGALIKTKNKKTKHEEDEHEATHCVQEVPPALILGAQTRRGRRRGRAGEIRDQGPCNLSLAEDVYGGKKEIERPTRLPSSWPRDHQMDRTVSRY